ncbi:MAG: tetratricopeptide repeat protein [Gemmatimonadetes bacterium]|nr:tetratricopeptide repeat protein [Gemmatimonadota bacterium]
MTALRLAVAALAAASLSGPLLAQGTCEIEIRKPLPLAGAALQILKHDQQATDTVERGKRLREAIKTLTDNPGRFKNEVGRNYLLGGAYVRWFQDQGSKATLRAKRGDLGFSENADGEFFLPAAMDEAMSVIEREMPACADSTLRYRNAVFSKVLNTAIGYYNTKQYDPAIEYAKYALQISPRSANVGTAYHVLANASQAKGDLAGAIAGLEQAIPRMGTDPASVPTRATATFNLAVLTRDFSMKQDGAARSAGLRRAAELFKSVSELAPDGPNAATARAAYARTLQEAGDTATVAAIYAEMIANPSKFTAVQLFEAGMVSANGKRFDDAARLYEAGLAMNPYHRDALFNAANVYFALHAPDKMAPLIERLRAVDPMNADVLKLAGAVWQERGRQATDPKAKQMAQDSTIAYLARAAKTPARVVVSQFAVARDGTATISGSVENLGTAATSFTVVFELLDGAGNGVGSTTVVTDDIGPRETKAFSTKASGAMAVAWRYTIR